MLETEFPENLEFLLNQPARLKVLWGGRGGGKTENVARALIILCLQKKLRVACFRELQTSIQESVHETIKNQIYDMKLNDNFDQNGKLLSSNEFDITDKSIVCKRTGSEFIFKGIRYNINSIKSLARIDIAWVEEAVNVSKTSWEKLGPTIRGRHESDPNGMGGPFGKGPEIWITFNPELETDETYKRFVVKRNIYAPDFITNENGEQERYAFVQKLNWSDNKWFPPDLRRDMELLKTANRAEWLHVWEGNTKTSIEGAIYAQELEKVLLEGRRGKVDYDPSRPVHTFWDLGWNDLTSIWFIQQVGVYYNLINYYQNRLQKIPHYLEHMQSLGYVYGFHHLPHDGDNETLASRSTAKIVRDVYPGKVKIIPRVAKKDFGIKAARIVFDLCNFDEDNTSEGWQALCHYQYGKKENGDLTREPQHDANSNGADGFQTFALSLKSEIASKKPKVESEVINFRSSSNGWMQ